MNNKKSTKRALLTSVLSLVICMTMLIGTTFAWFTDSVTSTGNIIKSGKLDAELNYKSKFAEDWKDASTGAIFDYDKWEPGYVDVKYVQVANAGNLAFKYLLNIIPETIVADGETNLADVIDVYVIKNPTAEIVRDDLADATKMTKVGTLASLMTDPDGAARGILLPEGGDKTATTLTTEEQAITEVGEVTMGLALKMQESAGNEYQELSVGGGFKVELLATQYMYEEDSFDDTYDKDSKWAGEVATADELQGALNSGGNIKLIADIEGESTITVPAGVKAVLDLNGHTLSNDIHKQEGAVLKNNGDLTISGGIISSTGDNGGSAIVNNGTLAVNDVVLNGAPNAGGSWPSYTVNNTGTMTVNDATITSTHGAICSYGANAVVTLNDTTIDMAGIPGFTSHGIYTYNSGKVIVNSGDFTNKATDQNASGASVINGAVTVNGGTFGGRIENYYGTPIIKGGTFNVDPSRYVATGYKAIKVSDNAWLVADVAGKTQVPDVPGLYTDDEGEYYVYTGEALATLNQRWSTTTYANDGLANKNTVINISSDIDFTGYTWTPVESHADTAYQLKEINGNGHTIKNLTINGQAMFKRFAASGDVTIKDITFDNATVNSTAINSSILTVQSYQNVLLDNVDVVNSTINGGYKVAPLIATVYNESSSTVTATLKNCDVKNCVVKATSYDFCTTGMVAFVYADDNDKIVFENCTVSDVTLIAPNDGYKAHAFVYTTGSESLYDEAEGVTVTNCKFEALK